MDALSDVSFTSAVSSAERKARYELAVICRVSDLHGLSDYCGGFAAVRIPGADSFIMRGHNQHPGQATVSNLIRCELTEVVPRVKNAQKDAGSVGMMQAIFLGLPDVNAIVHGHTPASTVFSALKVEIEPISQFGVMYHNKIGRIEFGAVDNSAWCDKLVQRLGSGPGLLFNNHGMLTVGRDAKEAYHHFYALEQAMQIQLRALNTGAPIRILCPAEAALHQQDYWGAAETEDYDGSREWEAWKELAKGRTIDIES